MSSIPFDLTKIKAFILDMDGVISCTISPLDQNGMPMRTVNVKDGYAMQYAVKQGYLVSIISGGYSQSMHERARQLGIQYITMRARDKVAKLNELMMETGITLEQIAYIGDDIPDIPVLERVALPVAPADAVPEVKAIVKYISPYNGGEGVVRDVIEQTMRANGCWHIGEGFGW
ncbi:KdsC family phosphatase [Porphyromonas pogonae]|uniref:KdsC family phosphatase n=1 Tax=Porphyromonas pogonae TaxID=867595 RepID=UPI002E7A44BB|nr:HAD hydrolase family protein [Porphyromonas pogonae]